MNTEEPVSTREATERLVKIIDCDYAKAIPKQVLDNANHMNAEDRTHLQGLLKDFEVLFDVTIGYWDTDPINLELNPDSKPFNCKYYPFPLGLTKITFSRSYNA